MNKKDLAELLKYSSSESIYVVTYKNELMKLHVPFKVLVLEPIGQLRKGETLFVSKVKVTKELVTVFLIEGNAYFFFHFSILID